MWGCLGLDVSIYGCTPCFMSAQAEKLVWFYLYNNPVDNLSGGSQLIQVGIN